MKSWATLEDRVREVASLVWEHPCRPARIGGVDIDGVVQLEPELYVLVEIYIASSLLHARIARARQLPN